MRSKLLSPPEQTKLPTVVAVAAIVVLAVCYVLLAWRLSGTSRCFPNFDYYGYFYPNILYALESLQEGEGVLWNRFQNCGQPFFATSLTALLYPPHLLFLILDAHHALAALVLLHLAIAGIGTFWLCRELKLDTAAALCGALAFEFGGVTLFLAGWTPTNIGNYVWMPMAVAATERLARRPTSAGVALLAVILSIQILAGYAQFALFTYQVILLRLVWECATNWTSITPRVAGAVLVGLALGPALAGVQLSPSIEVVEQSIRSEALATHEIFGPGHLDWQRFRVLVGEGRHFGSVFSVTTLMFVALSFFNKNIRVVLCYLLIATLSLGLAFDSPLLDLYLQLPQASRFRMPNRFLLITAFASSILLALGVQALIRDSERRPGSAWIGGRVAAGIAAAAVFWWLSAGGMEGSEFALVAAIGAVFAAAHLQTVRHVLPRVLPMMLAAAVWWQQGISCLGFWPHSDVLFVNRPVFGFLAERMSLQDRIFQFSKHPDYTLMPKSASLFRIPSIIDYEPQTSERYADLIVKIRRGHVRTGIGEYLHSLSERPKNRALLDLLSARYWVLSEAQDLDWVARAEGLKLIWNRGKTRVYENLHALPRAYFVPHAREIDDPSKTISLLSSLNHSPRETVLLERPPTHSLRDNGDGHGTAAIVSDESESLVVDVSASSSGFLVVTDQYDGGWSATVNGQPVELLRANYAFKAVPVPAGESTVVLKYRPRGLTFGIASTTFALILVVALVAYGLFKPRNSRVKHAGGPEVPLVRPSQ